MTSKFEPDDEHAESRADPGPGCTTESEDASPTGGAGSFRHLLACLDRSIQGERTLTHAATLARGWGARVTLLHVLERPGHGPEPIDPFDWQVRREDAEGYLEHVASSHSFRDVQVTPVVEEGAAAEQILSWASSHDVDFAIFSSHGECGPSGCGLASVTRKLIEALNCSFLLVPALSPAAPSDEPFHRRILLPLDGSHHSEAVIPTATRLATVHGAELILAHVLAAPPFWGAGPLNEKDQSLRGSLARRNELAARDYLERLRGRFAANGISTRTLLTQDGDPRDALGRIVAEQDVDLVLLSAHGSSGRVEYSCGSVTRHLLDISEVPALVVRTAGAHRVRERARSAAAPRGCSCPTSSST